jgi:hypothetical protein
MDMSFIEAIHALPSDVQQKILHDHLIPTSLNTDFTNIKDIFKLMCISRSMSDLMNVILTQHIHMGSVMDLLLQTPFQHTVVSALPFAIKALIVALESDNSFDNIKALDITANDLLDCIDMYGYIDEGLLNNKHTHSLTHTIALWNKEWDMAYLKLWIKGHDGLADLFKKCSNTNKHMFHGMNLASEMRLRILINSWHSEIKSRFNQTYKSLKKTNTQDWMVSDLLCLLEHTPVEIKVLHGY